MTGLRKTKTAELADKYLEELKDKRLPRDTPVMSVRALAMRFSVSLVTAQRILQLLEERDFIYRIPHKGSFIKNDAEHIPVIAYAGYIPCPAMHDVVKGAAIDKLLELFSRHGIEPRLIPYHVLCNPVKAAKALKDTDGLLLDVSYSDPDTRKILWEYPGRIVMAGNSYYEEKLNCSQVVPDYTQALRECNTRFDFTRYGTILLVGGGHYNAVADIRNVSSILVEMGVEKSRIEQMNMSINSGGQAFQGAYMHFRKIAGTFPEDAIVISMSEYISAGLKVAFDEAGVGADILSFDNFEDYTDSRFDRMGFTSIDRCHDKIWCMALELLLDEVKNNAECTKIVRVPSRLVIRRSIQKKNIGTI